jgi:hypothetical protein
VEEEKRVAKDNLVLITMVVFFAVMLVIAARAVLADPVRDTSAKADATDDAAATPQQDKLGSAPAAAQQIASQEATIWTADDMGMLRPVSYPVPSIPDIAPIVPTAPREREASSDDSGSYTSNSNQAYAVSVGPFIY